VERLDPLDADTSSILHGTLVMPKIASPTRRHIQKNHNSFENDAAAQAGLGPVPAKWLAQGILEYVGIDDRQPILLQPCGAVPKGSAPFYCLITDARLGNRLYA